MSIISHEQLLAAAGLPPTTRLATLRKALRRAGIPFKEVAGRLLSTDDAITAAVSGHGKQSEKPSPRWDALND